jgi:4-hydroxy-tetrahydrodipicolinate synthase
MSILEHPLSGVFAAAVTPLTPEGQPDLPGLAKLLNFLAGRGAHGALLLGTTGEGPAFSREERQAIWEAAAAWRETQPGFVLMAGTGTPSLTETIQFNQIAFDLGFNAVVTLPPYYLRTASDGGLTDWYRAVIDASVPDDKSMLGYHIPQVSGVGLSLDLLGSLHSDYSLRFAGIKDSTGQFEHAQAALQALPESFLLLVGNDSLLADGLKIGAAGCITAMANLYSAEARAVYDAFRTGAETSVLQERLNQLRAIVDNATPLPASLKALLAELYGIETGAVRAPLRMLPADQIAETANALRAVTRT